MQAIRPAVPLISFTFDDFPRSALLTGGDILKSAGFSGTFYTALGLIGKDSPSGQICLVDDLKKALDDGHELGCHTYSHYDSWQTEPRVFEQSIIQNRKALSDLIPGAEFRSFSFPLSSPRPMTKRAAARHFLCCRAGGQTINVGRADLNQLSGYFLEKAEGNIQAVKDLIDRNEDARGWIIFATHDVSPHPSPYGCTRGFFEDVLEYARGSGARILPVVQALGEIAGAGVSGK
jgi:peptidoglycan/xylan/chitin deacetylase (PgdA/CDA1 family)